VKVGLITIRDEIKKMYVSELKSVFEDFLEIIPYSIEIDHKYNPNSIDLSQIDIVLLTNPKVYSIISETVNPNAQIIYLDYAFLKNKIESLGDIPPNTKALICFNFYEVSVQAATTIYEMGYNNFQIGIYDPEKPEDYKDYDVAIVGESSAIVPEYIDKIYSLGRRKVSFKTLLDLATKANIFDDVIENRIYKYSLDIASPQNIMTFLYGNEHNAKSHLGAIMDSIDYSIVIIEEDATIINHNNEFRKMVMSDEPLINRKINEFPKLEPIISHIYEDNVENLMVESSDSKRIMLTIRKISNNFLANNILIILMKDVTDIFKLEKSLRRQIEKKGHVSKYSFSDIYGKSEPIMESIRKATKIAKMDNTVLILGESGTGKEIFAQSIHNSSPRKVFPFIGINCAALPSTLLESELFGYSDGTFTGARKGGKKGLFELADNGTLFLDEIGDMSFEVQAKILRVLEEKEFMRLGSGEVVSINVRVIAATNKNLETLIEEGKFRLDLYYRLNTFMFTIPPLRCRKDDIRILIDKFSDEVNLEKLTIPESIINILLNYEWKGNVRELKSCIEYIFAMSEDEVNLKSLPDYIRIMEYHEPVSTGNTIFSGLKQEEINTIKKIIEIIHQNGGGRRTLYDRLKSDDPDISEYRIRNYIELLRNNGLLEVKQGPTGIKLTKTGMEIYEESFTGSPTPTKNNKS
jgi:transcriptional regulator with PAS, ATPase and Fis domain